MNNLSWLLYLADLSQTASIIFGLGTIILLPLFYISLSVYVDGLKYEDEERIKEGKFGAKCAGFILVLLLVLNIALPSKETIYMIAASETGEEVLKSKEAAKGLKIINKWLDNQLGEEETTEDE